jgi:hypothetical protein
VVFPIVGKMDTIKEIDVAIVKYAVTKILMDLIKNMLVMVVTLIIVM